jgi:hypothetical protein
MRPYARVDSLRRDVLRTHLNHASRHDYGLRGLPRPDSDMPKADGPITCPVSACGGLVLQDQMHYMSYSVKVHNGPAESHCTVRACYEEVTCINTYPQAVDAERIYTEGAYIEGAYIEED